MSSIIISRNNNISDGAHILEGGKHSFAHSLACAAFAHSAHINFVPNITDSKVLISILKKIFSKVNYFPEEKKLFFSSPIYPDSVEIKDELLKKSRNVFCLLPALLFYTKNVILTGLPKGCSIGKRPSDWYFDILKKFGVNFKRINSRNTTILSWNKRNSCNINFEYPTMTGTVIAIAMASVSNGITKIINRSVEPSCDDQIECLLKMGGDAKILGNNLIIKGKDTLALANFDVKPDRIHAVTIITAALLTKGNVKVIGNSSIRIPEFIKFLKEAGVIVEYSQNQIYAEFPTKKGFLDAVNISSGSEPLFSSDWVACTALLLATRSNGTSTISDNVFPRRFQFIECLRNFGLTNISVKQTLINDRETAIASIKGEPNKVLKGGIPPHCDDIRGSATILLSSLVSDSPIIIKNDFQLLRGYENLPKYLYNLGIANYNKSKL